LCNSRRTLPLKDRRPHSPKAFHHPSTLGPLQLLNPLLVSCRCRHGILQLGLQSCLGLGLKLECLNQSRQSLKKIPKRWRRWSWHISLSRRRRNNRRNILSSSSTLCRCLPRCRSRRLGDIASQSRTTSSIPLRHGNSARTEFSQKA